MSTHVDGASPSVAGPGDGEPRNGHPDGGLSSGPESGSHWVRAEMQRRMAENRSTRGRHARRGAAAAGHPPVPPVESRRWEQPPRPPASWSAEYVSPADLPENYIPRHSVQTPGPAAEPAGPLSGPLPIIGGPSLPPNGLPIRRRRGGGPGTPLQADGPGGSGPWSGPGGALVPPEQTSRLGAPPETLGGPEPLPPWGAPPASPPRPEPVRGVGESLPPDGTGVGPSEVTAPQPPIAGAPAPPSPAPRASGPTPPGADARATGGVATGAPDAEVPDAPAPGPEAEGVAVRTGPGATSTGVVPDAGHGERTAPTPSAGAGFGPSTQGAAGSSRPTDRHADAPTTPHRVVATARSATPEGFVPAQRTPHQDRPVTPRPATPRHIPIVGSAPPEPGSTRVRVVLSERKGVARPVRTIKEVQEGTAVGELLRRDLIRSQLSVTLRFAALTVLVLGALPAVFALLPEVARFHVLGVRVPWLLLGALMYPFLVGVAWRYTRVADRVEQNFADHVQD